MTSKVIAFVLRCIVLAVAIVAGALWLTMPWGIA